MRTLVRGRLRVTTSGELDQHVSRIPDKCTSLSLDCYFYPVVSKVGKLTRQKTSWMLVSAILLAFMIKTWRERLRFRQNFIRKMHLL